MVNDARVPNAINSLFIADEETQSGSSRFGQLSLAPKERFAIPALAPLPRTQIECEALIAVLSRGAPMPALAIPVSRRKLTTGMLTGILGQATQATLTEVRIKQPVVVSDPEAEALSFPCLARTLLAKEPGTPDGIARLMTCNLRGNVEKRQNPTTEAWREFLKQYGYSMMASWARGLQLESRSKIFVAPTPLARASKKSFDEAWEIGWSIADAVAGPFRALGIHLLLHAEMFLDTMGGRESRAAVLAALRRMTSGPNPRRRPVVSLKIIDNPGYLGGNQHAATARQNLGELVLQMTEHIRRMDGFMVIHDAGTWGFSLLAAGCDITSFRCDGKKLTFDASGWNAAAATKKKSIRGVARGGGVQLPHQDGGPVQPWDPERLCFGRLKDFQERWTRTGGYPTSHFTQPEAWWDRPKEQQRVYTAKQIIGSMLELGQQLRDAGHDKTWRLVDHIRNRMKRMQETEALMDLYPLV